LTICVRDVDTLPPFAQQLVEHMRAYAANVATDNQRGNTTQ
jgi:hypothetical protein